MPIYIAALKRRYKPDRLLARFNERGDVHLNSAGNIGKLSGTMVDTTVYIHEFSGRLPEMAAASSIGL